MRFARIALGFGLMVAGSAMLALPGPGWLTIAAGLAVLAGDFLWARRLLARLRATAIGLGHTIKSLNGEKVTESGRSSHH
jgi:hypothetical protein